MAEFREERFDVNGIDTAVLTAGEGEPLVYFHGAGTALRVRPLLPLAERFRLIVPNHPGSARPPTTRASTASTTTSCTTSTSSTSSGSTRSRSSGSRMGGCLAALARDRADPARPAARARSPFGLRVPEHPTVDFFSIPDEEVPAYLMADMSLFAGAPMPPPPEFLADRYRESTSFARIAWRSPYDLKLPKWLHRIAAPTLLVWGDADRLIPVGQAAVWADLIPNAEVLTFPGVGHLPVIETREAVDAMASFVGAGATRGEAAAPREHVDDDVPVLIAGGSLVGLSTALFLGASRRPSLVVERHPGTAIHPRAALVNQRTIELYRGVGLEAEIIEASASSSSRTAPSSRSSRSADASSSTTSATSTRASRA